MKNPIRGQKFLVVVAATLFLTLSAPAFGQASFQGLGGHPDAVWLYLGDVSADGSTVLYYAGTSSGTWAFAWTESGGMQPLIDVLSGGFTLGLGWQLDLSADGSIVVGMAFSSSGREAFRWTEASGMIGLGDLPGRNFHSAAEAISAHGSVVVGVSSSASGREAFRWTEASGMVGLGDLPGETFGSRAFAVSADGSTVVGQSDPFPGVEAGAEAFRWTEASGMVGLGDLPGGIFKSQAWGVSADGSVVVGGSYSAVGAEAFRWTQASGMRSLKDVLERDYGLDLTGWTLDAAGAISADGATIVGSGKNPFGDEEDWIARVPVEVDPSALLFLNPFRTQAEVGRWQELANHPGCVTWNNLPEIPEQQETVTWTGSCVDGKTNGQGVAVWRYWEDGEWLEDSFKGEIKDGKILGSGIYIGADGSRYEGQWKNNVPHGYGIYIGADGYRHEGEYRFNYANGPGVQIWPDGFRFEGNFFDGRLHGVGTCHQTDGTSGPCKFANGYFIE